ncbi:MAG: hypothetical protein AAFN70_14670, partial [Planctomycetota bacterium]
QIAEAAPDMEYLYEGIAVRAGYPVPNPGVLKIGNVTLEPFGKRRIRNELLGVHFCVPKYRAMWKIRYRVAERPDTTEPDADDPVENPPASDVGDNGGDPPAAP